MRTVVPICGILVTFFGLATAGSAQDRKLPEQLCEEYGSRDDNAFIARVVGRDHVEVSLPPVTDSDRPPIRVDAVRAVVLESFRGHLNGEVLVAPDPLGYSSKPLVPRPSWELARSFDPPLEVGASYMFYASSSAFSSDHHLLARLVFQANSDEISELRRRSRMTAGSVFGRLESIAVSGPGLTTFLGRVTGRGYLDTTPHVRIEEVRIAVLESFGGITTKETSIVPPASQSQGESPPFLSAFRPSLEIGDTYLFVAHGGTLEYDAGDGSTRRFSGFIPDLILSRDFVPLERLRSLGRELSDRRTIVIAKADKTGFEARVDATRSLQYRFEDLPPGTYSFAVEAAGIVFMSPQSAQVRSGGCAAVDLINMNYSPRPVADCSSTTDRAALCNKFPGARFIFMAEYPAATTAHK